MIIFSVSRHPCHDIHWVRVLDDIPEAIWIRQCRTEPFGCSARTPVGNPDARLYPLGWENPY